MSLELMEGEGAMERRIRIVGLCLIAVFALSAVVAVASAQATVEIGQCVKTAKTGTGFKGRYTEKNCSEASEATPAEIGFGGKKNKYDWSAGGGGNGTYTGTGKTVKITVGELEVECKKSAVTGSVRGGTGPDTLEAKFSFKACIQPKSPTKKAECKTKGKEGGEIETKELVASLEENGAKEAEFAFTPKKGEAWGEFECKETPYTLIGTLTGKDAEAFNTPSKKGGPIEFVSGPGQELVAQFPNPLKAEEKEEEPATLVFTESQKFEAAIAYELRQTA